MENDYTEQFYKVECRGRDASGKEVLSKPENVLVKIHQGVKNPKARP
ncbi:hypothetical protein J4217_01460 [Candidatus Pacearchaeota archaeon]|nr:hypothetical protein [Candidatus Pacearchaeota archaeon]